MCPRRCCLIKYLILFIISPISFAENKKHLFDWGSVLSYFLLQSKCVLMQSRKCIIYRLINVALFTFPPSALYSFSLTSSRRASPKSVILMWFGDLTKTFLAARSLWTSLRSSRYIIPCNTQNITLFFSFRRICTVSASHSHESPVRILIIICLIIITTVLSLVCHLPSITITRVWKILL